MKDIQKIKEFFSKPIKEGNEEYFKPVARKDKSNPNFLYVDIAYPEGSGVLSVGGSKTMSGQDREEGAVKALSMGNAIVKKLEAKYNIEDIEVKDLKNGKVQVFAVSDDFTKISSPSLDEAKKETGIDMVKKRLDALGVKYEMSKTDKVRPFKVIYKPINKSDKFYDEFEDIVDLFNLKGFVKTSMSEAKEEDKVDTITMDIPLFIRMLEYSREDAAEDMDLHDVTEKAISLGKERGILQMDDYAEIVGAAEDAPKGEMKEMDYGSVLMRNLMPGANDLEQYVDILIMDPKIASSSTEQEFRSLLRDKVEKANFFGSKDKVSQAAERILAFGNNAGKYSDTITRVFNMIKGKSVNEAVNLKQAKLSSAEYQKAKKLKDFKASDWKWNASEDLYTKVNEGIERKISEALNKINEELCPAGKAYIKKRQAAGEKSSAYLSGRAVKVCKGQMSATPKKKK
jgi:hypothetical protein